MVLIKTQHWTYFKVKCVVFPKDLFLDPYKYCTFTDTPFLITLPLILQTR